MAKKEVRTWIWFQDEEMLKAVLNGGKLTVYDKYDNILLRRTGVYGQETQAIIASFGTICL